MKNNPYKGTGKVYSFTVSQFFKSRANLISLIVLLVFALLSVPVMCLFSRGSGDSFSALSGIDRVYVRNETKYDEVSPLELSLKTKTSSDVVFETAEDGFDAEKLGKKDLYVSVRYDDGKNAFTVDVLSAEDSSAGIIAKEQLAELVKTVLNEARLKEVGYGDLLSAKDFSVRSGKVSDYGKTEDDFGKSFGVQYGYSLIMMMVCTLSASYIIRTVIEEKSSKLADLMLVSVNPRSLMAGKILGVMTCVFIMLVSIISGVFISYFVSSSLMDVSPVREIMASPGFRALFGNVSPGTAAIIFVSILLGYLTFSAISGILGASASSLDETESVNAAVVFIILFLYIASLVVGSVGGKTAGTVISLIPLISVFAAPVQFILGNIGVPALIVSWIIEAAAAAFLLKACAAVYSSLILYKGSRLKLRQIVSVLRGKSFS